MTELLDLLLKYGIPFNIRGSSTEDRIEMYYQVKREDSQGETILYTLKEYYNRNQEAVFDFFDFTCSPSIEIQNLNLAETQGKVEQIAATLLFDTVESCIE